MAQDKNFGKPVTNQPPTAGKNIPGQTRPQGTTPFAEQKGGSTWTGKEIDLLKQLVGQNTPVSTISTKLGKTEDAITAKARELKLTLATW